MIIWMMVGKMVGPRPRYTSPNSINTFSNIKQVRVVNIFSHTYMPCTLTATNSSFKEECLVWYLYPTLPSPPTVYPEKVNNLPRSPWIGGGVAGRRPISTSPFNINSCYLIVRDRFYGILWPISAYINISFTITRGGGSSHTWTKSTTSAIAWEIIAGIKIPMSTTFTTSVITWGRVAGLKIHMSTIFLAQRNFKTFFLRTFLVIIMTAGIIVSGIMIPIS